MDWFLLILGAALGVAADRIYSKISTMVEERRRARRQELRSLSSKGPTVTEWLLRYYANEAIHTCLVAGESRAIPLFTDASWQFSLPLEVIGERLRIVEASFPTGFSVDHGRISMRQGHGQRLFNNPTYYTYSMDFNDGIAVICISATDYFYVASNLIGLEEEVFTSIAKSRTGPTPIRDAHMSNKQAVQACTLRPLSFGVNVGLVLSDGDKRKVMLQTRSAATVTYGGAKALFPSFGLAPIGSGKSSDSAQIIYQNFIKEYLEEIYDYQELVDSVADRRLDPLWFMDLPEAVELKHAREASTLAFTCLGFGVDLLSGTTTISMLAELSDAAVIDRLKRSGRGNWEVADAMIGHAAIELIDLDSPRLGELHRNGDFHPGSAFTLELIQKHYSS